MKKLLLVVFILMVSVAALLAQVPQRMTYQAVVRNAGNSLVVNQNVSVRISILWGSEFGGAVYVETHNVTTNANGLMTIAVGSGDHVPGVGTFNEINWANGPYFLKSEIDPTGGVNYSITGLQQLLSVPYALYAGKAGNVPSFVVVPTSTGYEITITQDGVEQTFALNHGTPGAPGAPGQNGENGAPALLVRMVSHLL